MFSVIMRRSGGGSILQPPSPAGGDSSGLDHRNLAAILYIGM
jgi:hypothetical protein